MNTFESLSKSVVEHLSSKLTDDKIFGIEVFESQYVTEITFFLKKGWENLRLQAVHYVPSSCYINQTHKINLRVENEDGNFTVIASEYILEDQENLQTKLVEAMDKYFDEQVNVVRQKLDLFKILSKQGV